MHRVVYVVGGDKSVMRMFESKGWIWFQSDESDTAPDLVCFTGGEDVSPYLYGEENISSYCNPIRDEFEKEVYSEFVGKAPMVGICRGGQFLNVMNGGKMVQHIEGHSMGVRKVVISRQTREIHEDHHQGIVPWMSSKIIGFDPRDGNIEIVWYEDTRCLCFQPHPEWGHDPTKELFFELLEGYVGL